ncbi:lycopene cyclase domain-containing protein [Blastococcus sp. Marseille-P5729]|uniref:lycopene cyclase domain-containing protein n=1 Tax=Blastococcus sp. Marseille-P5729 TaxID=2086582 RepID=UPI000D0FB0AF|nr:lycopene cyclase domain-containing protein [Blastococcus sp. Marseille-P5729]
MGHWTYVVILLGTFAAAAWLEAWPGVRVLRSPRRLLLSLIPGVAFLAWDIVAAARGWWALSEELTMGPRLWGLPVEEVAFFVVVPTCAMLGYEAVRVTLERWRTGVWPGER